MFGEDSKLALPTVMLIDDDLVCREVTATMLTMNGYTVHTANSGATSLGMLESGQCAPHVILMDAQMPDLNGLRLIEQLRARTLASIYAISGSRAPDEVMAAADGFLLKPFGPDALKKLLEKHTPAPLAPATKSGELVVSAEALAQFREMMPESTVREVYLAVCTDLANRIAALEVAIASGDNAEVRRIGHAIKGGCGMAGALQAARIGARLESESNHPDGYAEMLRDLRSAAHNLERMLNAEFPA